MKTTHVRAHTRGHTYTDAAQKRDATLADAYGEKLLSEGAKLKMENVVHRATPHTGNVSFQQFVEKRGGTFVVYDSIDGEVRKRSTHKSLEAAMKKIQQGEDWYQFQVDANDW